MPYRASVNSGLPNIPSPTDPDDFAEASRMYNAIRNILIALDLYTGNTPYIPSDYAVAGKSPLVLQNASKIFVIFSEAITYGQTVNLFNVSGVLQARLSNASASKAANGFCSKNESVSVGSYGEVTLLGLCTGIGGLTPGATYYLGNTAGSIAPTAGTLSQKLGYALGTSQLFFNPDLV